MDRNTLIGITLIISIFIAFSILNSPSEEEREAMKKKRQVYLDSIEQVNIQKEKERAKKNLLGQETEYLVDNDSLNINKDSIRQVRLHEAYGAFHTVAKGENEFYQIENDKLILKVSSKGGRPYSVTLKEFTKHDSAQVQLFDGDDNEFGFSFYAQNRRIATNELFFKANGEKSILVSESNDQASLKVRLEVEQDKYIEYVYTLTNGDYMMRFDVNFVNLNDILPANISYIDFRWKIDAPGQEKGRTWELDNSTVYYKHLGEEVDYLTERSDVAEVEFTTKGKWVAFKQQFFSSILIADKSFESFFVKYRRLENDPKNIMNFLTDVSFEYRNSPRETIPLQIYFGPNKHKVLKQYDLELESLIPLGWGIFGWVNMIIVIPLFNFLGSFLTNYGLIILIMTVIIKVGLFPLTYKSYLSTAKMRVLKPQIEKINQKFPKQEDAMKKQQAVMALYRKVGVSPMGGCLPMLLQFPILIAMFRFFPASIELRQKSFLWAEDLSTYDAIISWQTQIPLISEYFGNHISLFTVLMALSMILTTRMNNSQMDTGSTQMPGMKMMMYMMPVMMLFWFNGYSSALSYYYLLSNLITYGQTIAIRKFVDDDEILKKLEENKKKPVKKSGFQQRLEEMAKKKGYQPPKKKK